MSESESIRLAKRVVDRMACSRREAEIYIEGGWVQVDGEVIEEAGYKVRPEQTVELLPQATLTPAVPITILLHKPADVALTDAVATLQLIDRAERIEDDRSGITFLKRHLTGLEMLTPLETEASGLLVFSQDWQIKRKLIEDAGKVEQEYIVEVGGEIAAGGLALLNHGLAWNGKPLPPIKVSRQNETRLRFAMKSPDRGLIAHMCAKVDLEIVSMRRIRIGRVPMANLPIGKWRYLLGYERF
ncbi:MAG TPA: rRNA pseudouridine synthase [Herbaspirillum sp.]|nr:rRNA pseudouridine synthase [Herbaspirillum sp.]